jgi:hypothetical protein
MIGSKYFVDFVIIEIASEVLDITNWLTIYGYIIQDLADIYFDLTVV